MKKMMKKLTSVVLALLVLAAGTGFAGENTPVELNWTERVLYWGSGIFEIDFMRDVPWRTDYIMTVVDAEGNPHTVSALGGDADEAVVQVQGDIRADIQYTFTMVSAENVIHAVGRSTRGTAVANYCEYCLEFGHDERECAARQAAGVNEVERCGLCGDLNHDDDFCPERRVGEEYCDECANYGHDDDFCPYDSEDDFYDPCDLCGALGHDEERCTNAVQPTPKPELQSAATAAPKATSRPKRCDECGETGHDDDHCPNERCDECGKKGHDDDHCPYDD